MMLNDCQLKTIIECQQLQKFIIIHLENNGFDIKKIKFLTSEFHHLNGTKKDYYYYVGFSPANITGCD